MSELNIASNENTVFITIPKTKINESKIKDAINYLRLIFADKSELESVDEIEQQELEKFLDSLSPEDLKPAFTRKINI
ncbi:MAG: hypothetical protein KJ666_10520 [Bacteroidetes bacterium]|nr:hypothetical protein [Bacteroidota bacterium]MBU2584765.1 hypothetical protein [Bacteroidota bacterium]